MVCACANKPCVHSFLRNVIHSILHLAQLRVAARPCLETSHYVHPNRTSSGVDYLYHSKCILVLLLIVMLTMLQFIDLTESTGYVDDPVLGSMCYGNGYVASTSISLRQVFWTRSHTLSCLLMSTMSVYPVVCIAICFEDVYLSCNL